MMMKFVHGAVVPRASPSHRGVCVVHLSVLGVMSPTLTSRPGVVQVDVGTLLLIRLWQTQDPAIQGALHNITKAVNAIGGLVLLVARKANVPEAEISKAMGKAD